MPHYTEIEMVDDLVEVYQEAAPTAVVYPFWAITGDVKKWPALMVSDAAGGKTYGFVIDYWGSPEAEALQGGVRSNREFEFKITGIHWQDEESNMKAEFLADTRKVRALFDRETSTITLPASFKLHGAIEEDPPIQAIHGNQALIVYVAYLKARQC